MNCSKRYTYPDPDDKLTIEMINKIDPGGKYWGESEKQVLELMKEYIHNNQKDKNSLFLDAGCGDGRLLPEFEPYFKQIMAIDPDSSRLKKAKKLVEKHGFFSKILLQEIAIEDLRTEMKFDVILCSHVLQHVMTELIPDILKNFRSLLKDDGLLFITTCHSSTGISYFVKDILIESRFLEKQIDQKEFNRLVNSQDSLPIHFFSRDEIYDILSDSDFKVVDFKVFHILEKDLEINKNSNIDFAVNSDQKLQSRMGRDMLVVATPVR